MFYVLTTALLSIYAIGSGKISPKKLQLKRKNLPSFHQKKERKKFSVRGMLDASSDEVSIWDSVPKFF